MITKVYKGSELFPDGEFSTIVGNKIKYFTKAHPIPIYAQIHGNRVFILKDGIPSEILAKVAGTVLTAVDGMQVSIFENHIYFGLEKNSKNLIATFEGDNSLAAAAATLLLLRIDFNYKTTNRLQPPA